MRRRKLTMKNFAQVTDRLHEMARKDKGDAKVICDALNEMLDDLDNRDFFGTEGQLDPRGDRRD